MNENFLLFRSISTIVLSAMVGLLAIVPLVTPDGKPATLAILISGGILGGLVGYRRRKSHLFFYFVLVAAAILATILFFNMV